MKYPEKYNKYMLQHLHKIDIMKSVYCTTRIVEYGLNMIIYIYY